MSFEPWRITGNRERLVIEGPGINLRLYPGTAVKIQGGIDASNLEKGRRGDLLIYSSPPKISTLNGSGFFDVDLPQGVADHLIDLPAGGYGGLLYRWLEGQGAFLVGVN